MQDLRASGVPARLAVELLKPCRLEQPSKDVATGGRGVEDALDAIVEVVLDGCGPLDDLKRDGAVGGGSAFFVGRAPARL